MFCVKPKTLTEGFGLRVLPKTTRSETEQGARSNPSAVRVIVVVSHIQRGIGRQHEKTTLNILRWYQVVANLERRAKTTKLGGVPDPYLLLEWRDCLATCE